MLGLDTLIAPIMHLLPPPLRAGASAIAPALNAAEGLSAIASLAPLAARALEGLAGQSIESSLENSTQALGHALEAGKTLDELEQRAGDLLVEARNELMAIAAACLQEAARAASATLSTGGPVAALSLPAVLAPIGAAHLAEAQQCIQHLEAELHGLAEEVSSVLIPNNPSSGYSAPAAGVTPAAIGAPESATAGSDGLGGHPGSAAGDGSPGAPSPAAQAAVTAAKSAIGTPYQWGGTVPGQGLDCSGLTQWAYAQAGVELPRLAEMQTVGSSVPAGAVQPGDLAVWDGHVAMVIEGGQMIEAGDPVQINPIRQDNIGMAFKGFYRPTG